ncbi:MAG TPA: PilZ domain-containing protein [Myxococcota bacterium]
MELYIAGAEVSIARVIDASMGGAYLELRSGRDPPALSSRGTAVLRRAGDVVERAVRVVRVRWRGRERGEPVPPAVALVFEEQDEAALTRIDQLLRETGGERA